MQTVFLPATEDPPSNQPPTASFNACTELSCTFDASASATTTPDRAGRHHHPRPVNRNHRRADHTALVADSQPAVGPAGGLTATADAASAKDTMSLVIAPAS